MNVIVLDLLGKHVRRTLFIRPKPSSLWDHHVIPWNFRLSFYGGIYSVYIFVVFPNKPDEDWYWPVEILCITSAFFRLFDQSLR